MGTMGGRDTVALSLFFSSSREPKTCLQMSQVSLLEPLGLLTPGSPGHRSWLPKQQVVGNVPRERPRQWSPGGGESAWWRSKERQKAGQVEKMEAQVELLGRAV